VDCSISWQDSVETATCVTTSLLLNGWITQNESVTMSPDDQRTQLMTSLNQYLNGSFHTFVELSSRYLLFTFTSIHIVLYCKSNGAGPGLKRHLTHDE
jgi:hypothetical protein